MKTALQGLAAGVVLAGLVGCSKQEDSGLTAVPDAPERVEAATAELDEPAPEGKVSLLLQWPAGRALVNQAEWTQKTETYFPQTPEPLRQETVSTQRYTLTVLKELEDGGRELRLDFADVSIAVRMGDRPLFVFDSASDEADDSSNPVAAVLGRVPGQQFTFVMDAQGQVGSIPGLDEFVGMMTSDAPAQARPVVTGMYSDASVRQLVELGRALPKEPVEPGDHWPVREQFSLGVLGSLSIQATNTFASWDPRDGRLHALVTSSGAPIQDSVRAGGPLGMQTSVGGGESTGSSWFDYKLGYLVESHVSHTLTLLMHMSAVQSDSAPITNQMEQTFRIRLVQAGP